MNVMCALVIIVEQKSVGGLKCSIGDTQQLTQDDVNTRCFSSGAYIDSKDNESKNGTKDIRYDFQKQISKSKDIPFFVACFDYDLSTFLLDL